jgi:cytoplasmic iron level regulating protein YaaA (DUF328/UPF0246 family)
MIILLSPAKDLAAEVPAGVRDTTQPALLAHSEPLIAKLRTFSPRKIAALMDVSDGLAGLNHARYQKWTPGHDGSNARPAAFVFNGEAYKGLDVRSLSGDDLRFAQSHLRILSGLYGVLRPLDLIQDHRLEMGTALSAGRKKDLYAYWGERIAQRLKEDLHATGSSMVLNLASAEYFKAARAGLSTVPVVTPVFKDRGPGGYRTVMMFAKHQRGAMARYAIQHRLMEPASLRAYDVGGYRYSPADSTNTEWVFLRG